MICVINASDKKVIGICKDDFSAYIAIVWFKIFIISMLLYDDSQPDNDNSIINNLKDI